MTYRRGIVEQFELRLVTGDRAGVYRRITAIFRPSVGVQTRLHHQLWEGLVVVVPRAEIVWASPRLYDLGKHQRPLAHGVISNEHALVVLIRDGVNLGGIGGR